MSVLPYGTLSQTLHLADFFCFFRHNTLAVASVVNLVYLLTSFFTAQTWVRQRAGDADRCRRGTSTVA